MLIGIMLYDIFFNVMLNVIMPSVVMRKTRRTYVVRSKYYLFANYLNFILTKILIFDFKIALQNRTVLVGRVK